MPGQLSGCAFSPASRNIYFRPCRRVASPSSQRLLEHAMPFTGQQLRQLLLTLRTDLPAATHSPPQTWIRTALRLGCWPRSPPISACPLTEPSAWWSLDVLPPAEPAYSRCSPHFMGGGRVVSSVIPSQPVSGCQAPQGQQRDGSTGVVNQAILDGSEPSSVNERFASASDDCVLAQGECCAP